MVKTEWQETVSKVWEENKGKPGFKFENALILAKKQYRGKNKTSKKHGGDVADTLKSAASKTGDAIENVNSSMQSGVQQMKKGLSLGGKRRTKKGKGGKKRKSKKGGKHEEDEEEEKKGGSNNNQPTPNVGSDEGVKITGKTPHF